MTRFLKPLMVLAVVTVLAAVVLFTPGAPHEQRIYAQWVGAVTVPGFAAASSNAITNAAIGSALAVTNPASNFVMLIQGGPVYCGGAEDTIAQSSMTLLANTTYQIEYNCASSTLYAKTAVTLPGGQVPTTSGGSPGTPGTFLAPIAGVEIPIATVVCNATACGNGGNGSITDNRPVSLFPGSGSPLNTSTFANLPTSNVTDGTVILCTNCTQPTTGSVACTSGAATVLAAHVGAAWRCF